jgi:diaminopimelate decarboxylase
VIGIDVHIGSQLTDLEPFEIAYTKVAELTRQLREDGHDIRRLDLGGGSAFPTSGRTPPRPCRWNTARSSAAPSAIWASRWRSSPGA